MLVLVKWKFVHYSDGKWNLNPKNILNIISFKDNKNCLKCTKLFSGSPEGGQRCCIGLSSILWCLKEQRDILLKPCFCTYSLLFSKPVNIEVTITRSVQGKFNCITVNFDRTQHGIY